MHSAGLYRSKKLRLKLWILVFVLALAIPTVFLIWHAYDQLKWEAFHRHRVQAEEFSNRVDRRIAALIDVEQERSFGDYAFLKVSGKPPSAFLQRSLLSGYPVESGMTGLIGYFQIDPDGSFSSPVLPADDVSVTQYGISDQQADQRHGLEKRIFDILDENSLVQESETEIPREALRLQDQLSRDEDRTELESAQTRQARGDIATPPAVQKKATGQSAFDRLREFPASQAPGKRKTSTLGRVEDLQLESGYPTAPSGMADGAPAPERSQPLKEQVVRMEQSALVEKKDAALEEADTKAYTRVDDAVIEIFESKIEAFDFASLSSGHFVLYRNVWRDNERYVQGALIDPEGFVAGIIRTEFLRTSLAAASDLVVAYGGDVIAAISGQSARQYLSSADELQGTLLLRTRLSAPVNDMEMIFSITHLPAGPGAFVLLWLAVILAVVLIFGSYLMYRMGAAQVELVRQQQDFISAVSHELKTPLTSIRMYGEMLKEGWVDEDKRQSYYSYISDESERLSRLIANVLQLTRLNRNDRQLEMKSTRVSELIELAVSRIETQLHTAGFELNVDVDEQAGDAEILADSDAFVQIIINLVDNAIKFSAGADNKQIDLFCTRFRDGSTKVQVRDYGAGVPRAQMKKIFKLFYRAGDELTRETAGTGIGLALVKQLATAMQGHVDVVNREPGAEFVLVFPDSGS
jgi:signal transduction histidine kinase